MDFQSLAKERYSVRQFSAQPIAPEKLRLVLEAGRVAPTAANRQPQRILLIEGAEQFEKLKLCTRYTFDAPAALLVCYDKTVCWVRRHDGKNAGDIDASIVTTHMMMQAADLGLGTTWVMYFDPDMMRKQFDLPAQYEPSALLVIGNPADDAAPSNNHEKREPLTATVFDNDFHKPFV